MKALMRFQPFSDDFQPLPALFHRFLGGAALDSPEVETHLRSWSPRCDIHERDEKIVVSAEVPGLAQKDLEVQVEGNVLTLRGTRLQEKQDSSATAFRTERFHGSFARSFTLPATVDTSAIEAELRDGVLRITLPKVETARTRKVKIKSQ